MASSSERRISPDSGPASCADPQIEATARTQTKPKRRNRVIQSCLACRRRKTKCDRGDPCAPCRSSGQECVYLGSATKSDAEFRQKLVEMKDAKDALDATLAEKTGESIFASGGIPTRQKRVRAAAPLSSDDSDDSADDAYLQPTPLAVQDAAYGDDVDDDIDDLGVKIGRMHIGERIGGLYRPRIADEILSSLDHSHQGTSPLQSVPTAATQLQPTFLAPSAGLIFGQIGENVGVTQHIPPRPIADRFLEHYWYAVHPVARIVHRPSFAQRYETLWECIENGQQVSASLAAIVSAVLFSARLSMSEAQVLELCRTSGQVPLVQLKLGTEVALSKAQLLKSTKIETLQASVAYMLSMCVEQISRAHSVITGMLVRLAECMGLHRDPTEFGFSPIECQIRRLIWYQICYLDLKTSEIQGPRTFIHHDGYTTQLPFQVVLPQKSPNWNDMVFSVIQFECQEMQRRCLAHRNLLDQRRMTLMKALSKIEAFRISMDAKYGPYINTSSPSPMQKMAGLLLKLRVSLLYLIPLHRYMNSVSYRMPNRLRQIVLLKGTEALEAAVKLESTEEMKHWAWYSATYQQYHTAFLLLFEVFNFPRRREANRIWCCLDFIFAEPLANLPPISTAKTTPSLDEVIEYRAIKARYLLTLISERMRAYHQARRSKLPSHFNESIIVITPQKAGDDLDPHMPLNYAHGESESSNFNQVAAALDTEQPVSAEIRVSQIPSRLQETTGITSHDHFPHFGNNPNSFATSGTSSPWIQTGYSELDGESSGHLHPNYLNGNTVGTLPIGPRSPPHPETQHIYPQSLEINWELWDTIFPPQANDGNLDISDEFVWESQVPYEGTPEWYF